MLCFTRLVQLSCVMLYTTNIMVVVCHVVHVDEYSWWSCVLLCTSSIVVVVCHVVHGEYSGRVSCFARRK